MAILTSAFQRHPQVRPAGRPASPLSSYARLLACSYSRRGHWQIFVA
ncbi:hypothetical protein CCHR01_19034 [Colletotrichum chrysophilum]|uniref:Uncharacterized protein n=1 Tax=Colletotrichum chrysophilum TaxID=1836956 RepID=A0AAD8ZZN5_9PEZI|nr:hypothetical protein CCHR01_19034 [Colletotrichum chrysophilum]